VITETAATTKHKRERDVRDQSRRMSISYSLPVGREGRLLLCTRTRAETGDRAASSRTRGL